MMSCPVSEVETQPTTRFGAGYRAAGRNDIRRIFRTLGRESDPSLEMARFFGMFIDPIVKHRHVVSVCKTTILRTPSGTEPSQPVLQKRFKNLSGNFPVCHQAVFMFMQVRFLVDLKVVKIRILKLVSVK